MLAVLLSPLEADVYCSVDECSAQVRAKAEMRLDSEGRLQLLKFIWPVPGWMMVRLTPGILEPPGKLIHTGLKCVCPEHVLEANGDPTAFNGRWREAPLKKKKAKVG